MQQPDMPFFVRHEFLIRRLHSLTGLVPVGAYLCLHLLTNASVLAGAGTYQNQVDAIHRIPLLPLVEWTFIFLPIIFHAVIGVVIIRGGLPNTASYPYPGNVRYTLQRATAWIALFFIFYHVFHMHGWIHSQAWLETVARPLHGAQFDPERATSSAAGALGPLVIKVIYVIGTLASVFHLANGLWTMGITWGVWITPAAQRRADYLCGAFGVALAVVAVAALGGMFTADVGAARVVETVREQQLQEQRRLREQVERQLRAGEAEDATDADRAVSTVAHPVEPAR